MLFLSKYFIVPIPVNADGDGPEMDPEKVTSIVYEIWDEDFITVFTTTSKEEAQKECDILNESSSSL